MTDQDIPARLKNMSTGDVLDLPGVFANISVENALKTDRAGAAGKGATVKQAQGYSDFRVDLDLTLAGQEALDDLAKIQAFFRPAGADKGTPPTFLVVTPETVAMDVGELLWTVCRMDRSNYGGEIPVYLCFEEIQASDLAGPGGSGGGDDAGGNEGGPYTNDLVEWFLNSDTSHVWY